ncbi:MAG TPA: HemK family protein methyltransferase, partial [Ramlibacter sp.]|nr:HemK family protein methyltransferase [Ramlibacter sp.]
GTGSGAIALALKHRCPRARLEAVDASADALAVAAGNAGALGLEVALRQASWLEGGGGPYQLIVSNPPYIAQDDPHLKALGHEPRTALVAGQDGLDDLRAIISQAPGRLAPGGWLLLEHGWDQADAVAALLRQAGLADVGHRTDLAGIVRCSGGRRLELG